MPSSVTDRENPSTSTDPEEINFNAAELYAADQNENNFDPTASSTSRHDDTRNLSATLESIRAFPKAAPRQPTRKGRKRRTSTILTDSPQMRELAAEQESKRKKMRNLLQRRERQNRLLPLKERPTSKKCHAIRTAAFNEQWAKIEVKETGVVGFRRELK